MVLNQTVLTVLDRVDILTYQVGRVLGGAITLTNFTTGFTPDAAGAYTADITTAPPTTAVTSG